MGRKNPMVQFTEESEMGRMFTGSRGKCCEVLVENRLLSSLQCLLPLWSFLNRVQEVL
jgi:hypothetical protein